MGIVLRHKVFVFGVLGAITIGYLWFAYTQITNPSSLRCTGDACGDPAVFFSIIFIGLVLGWLFLFYKFRMEQEEEKVSKWLKEKFESDLVKNPNPELLKEIDFAGWLTKDDNEVQDLISTQKGGIKIYTFTLIQTIYHHKGSSENWYRVFLSTCPLSGHHRIIPKLGGFIGALGDGLEQIEYMREGLENIKNNDEFGRGFNLFSNNPNELGKISTDLNSVLLENHELWPFSHTNQMAFIEIADGKIALLCEPPKSIENMERGLGLIEKLAASLEK